MLASILTFLRWLFPVAILRFAAYLRNLLARPLRPVAFTVGDAAAQIALRDLDNCIEKRVLPGGKTRHVVCAGYRNFREPWARDFGFAAFGLLGLERQEVVKEGLETFLEFQRPDGQLPLKLHSTHVLDRYMHQLFGRVQPTDQPLRPKWETAHRTLSCDGSLLLLIVWAEYLEKSEDWDFGRQTLDQLRRALQFIERSLDDGLIRQAPFSDWADSIARSGKISYTNVLYWKAVESLERIETRLDQPPAELRAPAIAARVVEQFWDEERGALVTSRDLRFVSSDANLLAVAWGLTDETLSGRILDRLDSLSHPVPTRVTARRYPLHLVGIEMRLAGIPNYHMDCSWLWLGGWHVVALARAGRLEQARQLLAKIDKVIEKDGVVYEVHDPQGTPLQTLFYAAEAPLSWNAAMVLYAHCVMGGFDE